MPRSPPNTRPIGPYCKPNTLARRDGRTREAKLIRDTRAALLAHVGGKPSIAQDLLIDRAVQLAVRIALMDRKFAETGIQTDHDSRTYLAWTGTFNRTLLALGTAPAPEPAPDLAAYLASRAASTTP
jgi:hypothetical protein